MYQGIFKIGLFAYGLLLVLSIIFYKERTTFTDIAYHLFYILKDDTLAIQNFRYGAVVTQVFPLAASKLSAPLSAILVLYSAAFTIYYFICYLIVGIVLKNYRLALVLLLFNVLFVTDTFYWIQSEFPQGIAFTILFFALLSSYKGPMTVLLLLLMILGIGTIVFFHPLLIMVFCFIISFYYFNKEVVIDKKTLYTCSIIYFCAFLLKRYAFNTQYESSAMDGADRIITTFPHYFNLYSNKSFLVNCLTKYHWIADLGLAVTGYYLISRLWIKLLLFLAFFAGYLLLVNVSYPDSSTTSYYIENLYLPLSIFLAFPIVYDILPSLENKRRLAYGITALLIVTGVARIYAAHIPFTARLTWERSILKQNPGKKLVIDTKKVPLDTLQMVWGTPYEFWLLSTVEQGRTASVIVHDSVHWVEYATSDPKLFITTWGTFPYTDLPKEYFRFSDTISKYEVMK